MIRLGIRENWRQFSLLVLVNAFVGGMIGMERSVFPELAESVFGIEPGTAMFSFIMVFGISKAFSNLVTGKLLSRVSRKAVLVAGWMLGAPVPFFLMYATSWEYIVAANILMGIHQGLTWSTTVIMKTDLVGDRQRGLAMGLNEFAGYLSVALMAWVTATIADHWGIRPYPFWGGAGLAFLGLTFSVFLVKDTQAHVKTEALESKAPRLGNIFHAITWKHPVLSSVSLAGLVNNLNDGMMWGLLPVILHSKGFGLEDIGLLSAIYPAVWGGAQIITGRMADRFCRKDLMSFGMLLQGIALIALVYADTFAGFAGIGVMLGLGTALVYPTFLASVAEHTHPEDRAGAMGIFRLWRDLGYALGALLTGLMLQPIGLVGTICFIGFLTIMAGAILYFRISCNTAGLKVVTAIKAGEPA